MTAEEYFEIWSKQGDENEEQSFMEFICDFAESYANHITEEKDKKIFDLKYFILEQDKEIERLKGKTNYDEVEVLKQEIEKLNLIIDINNTAKPSRGFSSDEILKSSQMASMQILIDHYKSQLVLLNKDTEAKDQLLKEMAEALESIDKSVTHSWNNVCKDASKFDLAHSQMLTARKKIKQILSKYKEMISNQ